MCDDSFFCGVRGLVTGLTAATWVHMLLLAFVVTCTIDWEVEAEKAQDRLSLDRHKLEQSIHADEITVDVLSI
jgi:hypothetical protein